MHHLNPVKTGLALGKLLAAVHAVWAVAIALGWAQSIVNFSAWAHMISAPIKVQPFDLTAAVTLVIATGLVGYLIGFVFAKFWNLLHR